MELAHRFRQVGLIVVLTSSVVACAGGAAGRFNDGAAGPAATAGTADSNDPEAVLLDDELAPEALDDLSSLTDDLSSLTEQVATEPAASPAAQAGPADSTTRSTGTGPGSISTTEASQLLTELDSLLRLADGELAAFDDAATTLGE